MKELTTTVFTLWLAASGLVLLPACAQSAGEGLYACEGCEAVHEHSFDDLSWTATIPPEGESGERLLLEGAVYWPDGTTPAAGVVLYAYHTNAEGRYPTRGDETGWAQRHGNLRGWVLTDARGRYRFETIRPGTYPGGNGPAHVHLIVKEPGRPPYYIDEVVFADDLAVTRRYRQRAEDRGGSGIVALTRAEDGTWRGTRDVILEQHPEAR